MACLPLRASLLEGEARRGRKVISRPKIYEMNQLFDSENIIFSFRKGGGERAGRGGIEGRSRSWGREGREGKTEKGTRRRGAGVKVREDWVGTRRSGAREGSDEMGGGAAGSALTLQSLRLFFQLQYLLVVLLPRARLFFFVLPSLRLLTMSDVSTLLP